MNKNMYRVDINIDGVLNRFDVLGVLYREVLINDELFHFFNEPHFLRLRYHKRNDKAIHKLLDKRIAVYSKSWGPECDIVQQYPDFFTEYFHMASKFILENKDSIYDMDELDQAVIIDRVFHPIINMGLAVFHQTETAILARTLISRSRLEGYQYGVEVYTK